MANNQRIVATIPTLTSILERGGRAVLVSHLGRPKAAVDPKFSLRPVAHELARVLGREVQFSTHTVGAEAVAATTALNDGEVLLMENVRFFPGEESGDAEFAAQLAELGDAYVNDAFGTAHRAEATTHGMARFATEACAGPLMAAELDALGKALQAPRRPLVAIVAGSKVSTKLTILKSLAQKVDQLIVGGGIANTFMAAKGLPIGKSLAEKDLVEEAKAIMAVMEARGASVPIPVDIVTANEFSAQARANKVSAADCASDDMILDIGPQTAAVLAGIVAKAGTIVWNGPVGVFEIEQFSGGTRTLASAIAHSPGFSIAGGGDTLAAIAKYNIGNQIDYISTGGGAFLEFLAGKTLPAVAALEARA